jgi:Kef-type K+ transport system membrane component KefB
MNRDVPYSHGERLVLWSLGAVGAVVLNSVFIYGLVVEPEMINAAMSNPLAASFIVEALLLMCVFAYLLTKWGVSRLHWGWFIALSLLGSMAFALPVVLLWRRRRDDKPEGLSPRATGESA